MNKSLILREKFNAEDLFFHKDAFSLLVSFCAMLSPLILPKKEIMDFFLVNFIL